MASVRDEKLEIIPIPCLQTNYAYLLRAKNGIADKQGGAVVIDPSEFGPVHEVLEREGLTLEAIWITHHHRDHIGGVEDLCDFYQPSEIIAGTYDVEAGRVPRATLAVKEQDRWLFAGNEVCVWSLPGHTLGAIAYLIGNHVFTGDTLFLAGCGKVFEGTMAQMKHSLERFRSLAPDTQIWCGHEYTERNLAFAQSLEPANQEVESALREARSRRQSGLATVPGNIATELRVNPFLRCAEKVLSKSVTGSPDRNELETFAALRQAKDLF